MFLTALALVWILGRLAGVDAMALGLGAALLVAAGLWWTGLRQHGGKTLAWVPASFTLLLGSALASVINPAPQAAQALAKVAAEPFSESRLAELRAQGRPVFAYFTADWCVTCKVNEKTVIETQAVQDALKQHGVAVLVGDWTNGDPALGRFISAHNRAGVPLYLWYAKSAAGPELLPQLLSTVLLQDRFGK
jgi:thiol:disulfide interchange protein